MLAGNHKNVVRQLFAAREADELDEDDTTTPEGSSQLVVNRATAWQQVCLRQTLELAVKIERLQACVPVSSRLIVDT